MGLDIRHADLSHFRRRESTAIGELSNKLTEFVWRTWNGLSAMSLLSVRMVTAISPLCE